MTKPKLLGGILAAVVLVGGGFAWWMVSKTPDAAFSTDTVKRGDVVKTVDASGSVQRGDALTLAFGASGAVESVTVVPGGRVAAGTTIAKLDDDEFEAAVAGAQAAVRAAEAAERMVSGGSNDVRASAAAAVNQARAAHQAAMLRLRSTRLVIPVDAIITGVFMSPGEFVAAGMPAVTVETDVAAFDVTLAVSESDIAQVDVGQAVDVGVDAIDAVIAGVVTAVYPAGTLIEGAPMFTVIVAIEAAKGVDIPEDLRSAMTADAAIVIEMQAQALYVPRRAVVTRDGKTFVRVVDNRAESGYVEREVELGLYGDDSRVVVVSGLSEDEEIVTRVGE